MSLRDKLSGDEEVVIMGFAIAYHAKLQSPNGHYGVGLIGDPSMIQASDMPNGLIEQIEKLIVEWEKKKWGLVKAQAAKAE